VYRLGFIDGGLGFLRIFYPYSNKILAKTIIKEDRNDIPDTSFIV
jgi:hypothetical protein